MALAILSLALEYLFMDLKSIVTRVLRLKGGKVKQSGMVRHTDYRI